jgi:hypothetical protein
MRRIPGEPAHAQTENHAALRDQVGHRSVFGQSEGIIKRRQYHRAADLCGPRHRCQGRHHRQQCGQVSIVDKVMLGNPDRLSA